MKSIIRLVTALLLPLAGLQAAKPLTIQPRSVKSKFLSVAKPASVYGVGQIANQLSVICRLGQTVRVADYQAGQPPAFETKGSFN
jgi:hypothetical protein